MPKRKESFACPELLNENLKEYLGKVYTILCRNEFVLSKAGMNMGRSRLGSVNEVCMDALRFIVCDDEYLCSLTGTYEEMDINNLLHIIEIETGKKVPENILNRQQKEILTKANVLLEWGWMIAKEGDPLESYSGSPIGEAIKTAKKIINPLVFQSEFENDFSKIKNDKNEASKYYVCFHLQIKDELYKKGFAAIS